MGGEQTGNLPSIGLHQTVVMVKDVARTLVSARVSLSCAGD